MSDAFIGEIRLFPYGFAPQNWALCQGQLLAIAQNTALFAILGTQYGGDGRSNFALPNLGGVVPIGAGQGPGLSPFAVGAAGGAASVVLTTPTMAAHNHPMTAIAAPATAAVPAPGLAPAEGHGGGRGAYQIRNYALPSGSPATTLAPASAGGAGGGAAHNNMQPSLAMSWCIALAGIFPPRN